MVREPKPDRTSVVNKVVAAFVFFYGSVFLTIIVGGYLFEWQWTGLANRTLWDWMTLILTGAVPVLISAYGSNISRVQYEGQQAAEEQRAQDSLLQAYLEQIGQLLLDKDRPLRQSSKDDEERTLARARTVTVLARMDGERKRSIIQFLYEAGLIDTEDQIIDLSGADLSGAFIPGLELRKASLSGAVLSGAVLTRAKLFLADLSDADLSGADLSGPTRFTRADVQAANLSDADLSGAFMSPGTNLSRANLSNTNLSEAHLSGIHLNQAILSGTNLIRTDLRGAELHSANLSGADLSGADLNEAEGLSIEKLEREAKSLKDATMPNGQKYEDWLKDREKRQQDE